MQQNFFITSVSWEREKAKRNDFTRKPKNVPHYQKHQRRPFWMFTCCYKSLLVRTSSQEINLLIILILLILVGLEFLRLLGQLLFGRALPPTLACENLVAEKIIKRRARVNKPEKYIENFPMNCQNVLYHGEKNKSLSLIRPLKSNLSIILNQEMKKI